MTEADTAIIDNLILVRLSISTWNGRIQAKDVEREVEEGHGAAKGSVEARTKNLPDEYWHPISAAMARAKALWYELTLPWENRGWRVVPASRYQALMDGISEIKREFDEAVEHLLNNYMTVKNETAAKLGNLFDARKFPEAVEMAQKYGMWVEQDVIRNPSDLRIQGLSDEATYKIRQEIQDRFTAQIESTVTELVLRLKDLLEDVAERLGQTDKVPRYASMLNKVKQTCENLAGLNITGNVNLTKLIVDTQNKIGALDPALLKEVKEDREKARDMAKSILESLDNFGKAPEKEEAWQQPSVVQT